MWSPYKDRTVNKLETASLVTLVIFGQFNTVHATFITSGVHFWDPIKAYVTALEWIQACLLLLLPLALIFAIIFAVLSQVVRVLCASVAFFHRQFVDVKRRKSSSIISNKKSFENSKQDSLCCDAELIEYPGEGFMPETEEVAISNHESVCFVILRTMMTDI